MDRLSAMALLVKVAELGSMSAAARALNMPLTTVSRQIGELENTLGVRLMIRTTRKLTLTDAGVDYVAAARRILEEVENAERQAAGEYQEPKGELVLSAPTMFGRQHVLPVVTDFLARYPQIRVRLLLSDRNADLVGDHIDLAVRIGTLPDSGMVATRLGEMRIVTCAPGCWKNTYPNARASWPRYRSFVLNRRCLIAAGALTPKRRRTGWWRCSRCVAPRRRAPPTPPAWGPAWRACCITRRSTAWPAAS
jgi:DNA-binding transcriptional LysR family regulator